MCTKKHATRHATLHTTLAKLTMRSFLALAPLYCLLKFHHLLKFDAAI